MHFLFPFILLSVVLSWTLVTLWQRVLDGCIIAVGLRPDRLPDSLLVASVCTAALVAAIAGLGQAGVGLADSVAGMELSALRTPNPVVPEAWLPRDSGVRRPRQASPARRRRELR